MTPHNPFTPPTAGISQPPDPTPGSPWKAVLLGLLVDIGGSTVAGIPYSILYSIYLASSGMDAEEIVALLQAPPEESPYLWIGYGIGSLFSILGGYVCARIAKRAEYQLASLMATLSALFGVLMVWGHYSLQMSVAVALLSLSCVLLGAHLGRLKNRR